MPGVKTYLCDSVKISFFGIPLTGFADGDFVTVAPNAQGWNKKVGADGLVSRSRSNDFTNTVELTLEQTSETNTQLSVLAEADRVSALGKGPLLITDLSGTTLHFWAEAWLMQAADTVLGKETNERVWSFDTGQSSIGSNIVGGN